MRIEQDLIALVECLSLEMDKEGLRDPCFIGVLPGEAIALDYCNACDNGMAWARLVGLTPPQDNSDTSAVGSTNCYSPLSAVIEVGIIRGVRIMDERGNPIPADEQLEAFRLQMAGMRAMYRALTCCNLPSGEEISGLTYEPMGPQGGCVGGTFTASVRVN